MMNNKICDKCKGQWRSPENPPEHLGWVLVTIYNRDNKDRPKDVFPAFYEDGVWMEWPGQQLHFLSGVIDLIGWRELPEPMEAKGKEK